MGIATTLKLVSVSLLGIPIGKMERILTIELDIFDKNGAFIKSYNGTGFSKKYCALYWGYYMKNAGIGNSNGSLARATNSEAFKNALNEIKLKIILDNNELTQKLSDKKN